MQHGQRGQLDSKERSRRANDCERNGIKHRMPSGPFVARSKSEILKEANQAIYVYLATATNQRLSRDDPKLSEVGWPARTGSAARSNGGSRDSGNKHKPGGNDDGPP